MSTTDAILTEQHIARIQTAVEKAVADYIVNLPSALQARFTDIAMSTMGFSRNSWGNGYTVDNCNGRNTEVSKFIVAATRTEAIKIMNTLATEWLIELAADARYHDCLKQEFMDKYRATVKATVIQEAERQAREDAHEIVAKLATLRLELPLINTELANPDSFQGPIGEAMVWHHVRNNLTTVNDIVTKE